MCNVIFILVILLYEVVLFLFFTARTSHDVFFFIPHLWPEPKKIVAGPIQGPQNPGWLVKTFVLYYTQRAVY